MALPVILYLLFMAGVPWCLPMPSTRVVYYLHTRPASWNEASTMCHSYGAVLLTLAAFDRANNSLRYVDTHSWSHHLGTLSDGFWVGLYVNSTNHKRWQLCKDLDSKAPNPLINEAPGGVTPPDCYVSDSDLVLSPLQCSVSRPYICQRYDGQCWFQPYVDSSIQDPDSTDTHVNETQVMDEGECAKLCRNELDDQGRECWGFTFHEQNCRRQFTSVGHKYALNTNVAYFTQAQGHTAYVKICTGGWITPLPPPVEDKSTDAKDENCTLFAESAWDDMICYCECDQPPVILQAETLVMTIDEKVEKIVKELQVNPDNTSSTRRKKESAQDSRPSAQGIGYVGVAFLVVVFGGIFLMDLNVMSAHLMDLCKRLRGKA